MNPFSTPPDFFDPDDDGINEYFNTEGERVTRAEWLLNQPEFGTHESLPMSSDAYNRLLEASADWETYVVGLAEKIAREHDRQEVSLQDMQQACQRAFRQLEE